MSVDRQELPESLRNIRVAADVWARRCVEELLDLQSDSLPPSGRQPNERFDAALKGVMERVRISPEWQMLREGAALKARCPLAREGQDQVVGHLESAGVRRRGHVRFPQGCRVGTYHEFGRLRGNAEALSRLAELWQVGFEEDIARRRIDKVVAHGAVMEALALQTFALAPKRERRDVLLAVGVRKPVVAALINELEGKRVALFLDVVLSGGLVKRLRRMLLETYRVLCVRVYCVVLNSSYSLEVSEITGLCLDTTKKRYLESCQACQQGDMPAIFDPSFGVTFDCRREERIEEWGEYFRITEEWWEWFKITGALGFNKPIGSVVLKYIIDFRALLGNVSISKAICERAQEAVMDIAEGREYVIVSPRSNGHSRIVASTIAAFLNCEHVRLHHRRSAVYLLEGDINRMNGRCVIFVDAAIDGGSTVRAAAKAIRCAGGDLDGVFVVVDRTPNDVARIELEAVIGGIEIRSLMRFPFRSIETKENNSGRRSIFKSYVEEMKRDRELAPYAERICRPGGRGGSGNSVDPVREEGKRKVIERAAEAHSTGRGHRYFDGVATKKDLWELLRGMPPELQGNPEVKMMLCAFAHNGLPWDLKKETVKELIEIGCFDWVSGWLRANHKSVEDQFAFIVVALRIGIMRVPEHRESVLEEIRDLMAELCSGQIMFDSYGPTKRDGKLEALRELERLIA